MKKKFKGVVIHCSDSSFGNAQTIEDWHKERGWSDIGYHSVICNGFVEYGVYTDFMDGSIEYGRDWSRKGAHAKGYNDYFGICLIGVDDFTPKQLESLLSVISAVVIENDLNVKDVIGHNECLNNHGKTCPNFDVQLIRDMLFVKADLAKKFRSEER